MKRRAPEQALQMAVARYLDVALPDNAVWSAIGHGGGGKTRGAILKSMGLKAGIPDVLIVHGSRTLFIELKATDGRVSAQQTDMHVRLRKAGAEVYTCRSLEQVEMTLRLCRVPLRARVTPETRSAA